MEEGYSSEVRLRMGRLVFPSCEIAFWGGALERYHEWVGCFCKEH